MAISMQRAVVVGLYNGNGERREFWRMYVREIVLDIVHVELRGCIRIVDEHSDSCILLSVYFTIMSE